MRRVIPGLDALDERLEGEIRPRLDGVEDALRKAVEAESDVLGTTAGYLLAAGGKRFRPTLVLLAGYFGDATDPRLIQGAAAIELTHVATLYHDDVMDEAASRHGVPSVNTRWDNTIAILTGDFLFARSSELAADLGPDVCRLLAQTIAILCEGQIRDVASAGDVDKTEQDHLEVIRRKTGVLIASSCRMGGMLSDAAPDDLETLGAFGESLGLAFQLSDDIMDITATQLELGKEPVTDIREGVYTIPVLHALGHGPHRDELRRILAAGPPDGELLDRALEIVRTSGAIDHARAGVATEVARAIELARRLPEGHAQHALVSSARFLAERCGADVEARGAGSALLGYGRAGEGADGS